MYTQPLSTLRFLFCRQRSKQLLAQAFAEIKHTAKLYYEHTFTNQQGYSWVGAKLAGRFGSGRARVRVTRRHP